MTQLLQKKIAPVFVPKKSYSYYLLYALMNAHCGKILVFDLERFCEDLRDFGFKDFLDCTSIRSAFKALKEDNDDLYPVEEILSFTNIKSNGTDVDFVEDVFKNYKRIAASLFVSIDQEHHRKFYSINARYEQYLATANKISNVLCCDFINLKRDGFLANSFVYGMPQKKIICGTIIKTNFTIDNANLDEYPRFFPNLINRIFNEVPVRNLSPYLLSYDQNQITIFISSAYKDDVSVANEQIYMAVINTARQFKLPAPVISSEFI